MRTVVRKSATRHSTASTCARPGQRATLLLVFLLACAVFRGHGAAQDLLLTQQERDWLAAHPVISIAPDPAYPPIEYFDQEGRYLGIAADYIKLVEQKLGIRFKIIRLENWDDILEAARRREVDMFGAAAATPQRSEYMLFTSPFIEFPSVIIVRQTVNTSLTLDKLAGMRIAMVSRYADHDYVVNHYPQLDLNLVPAVDTGLRKLSFGIVDALVGNLAAATYVIEREGIGNLRVAGNTGYVFRLSFGCRNDWPELAAILDKVLSQISPQERAAILKKWVNLEHASLFPNRQFWISLLLGLGLVACALLGMLLWNRSLRHQVHLRTQQLNHELDNLSRSQEALRLASAYHRNIIETTMDAIVVLDLESKISDVNAAAEKVAGYSRAQLIGSRVARYFQEPEKVMEGFHRVLTDGVLRDYELEIRQPDGRTIFLLCNASLFRDSTGKPLGVCAVARDMTERRQVEEELRSYREHLEELVRDRTSTLAMTNDLLQQEINERRGTEHALLDSQRALRFLSSQLLTTQEEERKRIARELHDSIGQSLAAIKFNVESVLDALTREHSRTGVRALAQIIPVVQNAIEEARRIYTGLRPSILDDLGIIATIGWFCREFQKTYTGISIEQQINLNEDDIPEPLKIVIFRILQEAFNNIARHSKAELVNLCLERKNGRIHLTLEDNGIGFDLETTLARTSYPKGLGISGMKERTEHANGSFRIFSSSDQGTIIQVSWPA